MDVWFIIGLPKAIRRRLEVRAKRNDLRIVSVLADDGRQGTFVLLPHPGQTVHRLRAYLDRLNAYNDARILLLPYARIPADVMDEIETTEQLGGKVLKIVAGKDGWPVPASSRLIQPFLEQLIIRLDRELFPQRIVLPSDYFREMSQAHQGLIIPDGALDACDQVAQHRRAFFRKAADAFVEIIKNNGQVGPIDEFFERKGLEYAHTGGITATLDVYDEGTRVISESSNIHLKQGDATTPQAAARIYYHGQALNGHYYLFILYAGPHPETSVRRRWYLK